MQSRLALLSRVIPNTSPFSVISTTRWIPQNRPIIYPKNFVCGAYGNFSKSYKPRRLGKRNRPVIPFYDPTNKISMIKAHVATDAYYFIDPIRSTEAILKDFENGLYEINAYAFATLIYNKQFEAAWKLLRIISTNIDTKSPPTGRIYSIFMEHLKYPRTFKGMISFAKELNSRKIPFTNGYYQNLFILAAYERIEDLEILSQCVANAKRDLGVTGMAQVIDKIIDAYARISYEEVLRIANEAIAEGVDFNISFALSVMRACIENKDIPNLKKYYAKAAISGVELSDILGLVVQGIGLQQRDLAVAVEYFNKARKPVSNWLNFSMAHVYIELEKYDEALRILRLDTFRNSSQKRGSYPVYLAMKIHYLRDQLEPALEELNIASRVPWCRPEAAHYNLVFGMLLKRKMTKKAWETFDLMIKNKVYPTGVTYEILVNTMYDVDKLGSKAYEMFESDLYKRRVRPNDEFILKLVNVYASEGNEEKTLRSIAMLDEFKDQALLGSLKNSAMGNHLGLFTKLVEMSQQQVSEHNSRFIATIIAGYGSLGNFDEAFQYFMRYAKKEKHFISISSKYIVKEILKAASRCGQYEIFPELVNDCLQKFKITPFKEFYEIQIYHYARSGDLLAAENTYQEMLQTKRVKPDLSTYILMTFVYALQANTDKMQEFFNLIKQNARPSHWKGPIDRLLRNEEFKFAVEGFYIDAAKAEPTFYTQLFTIVMQGFSNAGCYSEAFLAYEMLKNTRVPIDGVVYSVLIDAIKHSGQYSRLEHALQDIKKENILSYKGNTNVITTLVEAFAAAHNRRKMIEMLVLAEKHEITPTTKLAGTFLHIFPNIEEPESALIRQLVDPNVRFEPEEPLDEHTRVAWTRYVKMLENSLENKNDN